MLIGRGLSFFLPAFCIIISLLSALSESLENDVAGSLADLGYSSVTSSRVNIKGMLSSTQNRLPLTVNSTPAIKN